MPCNAVLQQAGTLSLNPSLLLNHPQLLSLVAARLAQTLAAPVALCTPPNWHATYLHKLAQQPLDHFDFAADGALFFSQEFSIALYPDGRIEMRDGMRLGHRPENAESLLAQLTAALSAAAGLALQQTVAAQLATLGTITQSQQAPNGALTLSLSI